MWKFYSPFWDKIAELLWDKLQQKIKQIYGKIPKKYKKILLCIFIIMTVGFIALNIIHNISETDLSIVSVEINEDSEEETTTVNINFIIKNNNSESDRYVNQVIMHIEEYYEMSYDDTSFYYRLEPTYTYNTIIVGDNVPEEQLIDMSQVINAGGYDSFTIKVASCEANVFREILAKIDFEFICDNGEKIRTDEFLLALGCNEFDEEVLEIEGEIWRSIYDNYLALKRFNSFKCRYKKNKFIDVFNSYQKHDDIIMKMGKEQYDMAMSYDQLKITELNYEHLFAFLLYTFEKFENIDYEELDDGYLFIVDFKFNNGIDKIDTIYFSTDKHGKILSIFIPAKTDELDFLSIVFCNEIIELVDPSIDCYWYNQRIVDLNYHKDLRFWDDKNIYAKFVEYKGKCMLRIDLK